MVSCHIPFTVLFNALHRVLKELNTQYLLIELFFVTCVNVHNSFILDVMLHLFIRFVY